MEGASRKGALSDVNFRVLGVSCFEVVDWGWLPKDAYSTVMQPIRTASKARAFGAWAYGKCLKHRSVLQDVRCF